MSLAAPTARERRQARFRKVLAHIDAHLDGDLSVKRLSRVAALSPCHFHRQLAEVFGVGVYHYVQLCRLKRGAWRLAFRRQLPVLEIALDSGYAGPEAFARAFRKSVGQSPSAFRNGPNWPDWHRAWAPLGELRRHHLPGARHPGQVTTVVVGDIRVAALAHRGDMALIGDSVRRFIDWRRRNGLPPRLSATFNILHHRLGEHGPELCGLDLCAATDRAVPDNPFGVVAHTIRGGRCAVLRHVGPEDTLRESVRFLCTDWLAQSGETPRDDPPYLQRIHFFPDVPEHQAVTDVFLPLR